MLRLFLGGLFMGILDAILFPLFPSLKFDMVSSIEGVILLAFSLWQSRVRKTEKAKSLIEPYHYFFVHDGNP